MYRDKPRIGLIGGSKVTPELANLAYKTGRLIAEKGAILISGGLGGVMESASKGAKEAGGTTIGILPTKNPEDANPYIDIPIATGLGEARNMLVVLNSDVIIAIDGAYGTLTEIAYALLYKKPVIAIKSWELLREGERDKNIIYVQSAEEAVEKALALLK